MKGYAERVLVPKDLADLREELAALIEALPDHSDGGGLRSHELTYAVAEYIRGREELERFKLEVVDGKYEHVAHSWIVGRTNFAGVPDLILDVYAAMRVPMVQLVQLLHFYRFGYKMYQEGTARTDIDRMRVDWILARFKEVRDGWVPSVLGGLAPSFLARRLLQEKGEEESSVEELVKQPTPIDVHHLAGVRLTAYRGRLASGMPAADRQEIRRRIGLWRSIRSKNGEYLTPEELEEVTDAVATEPRENLVGPGPRYD